MVERVTLTFFIGADGEKFKTEDEALRSLSMGRLSDILHEASYHRDYNVTQAAEHLWEMREEVVSLLGGYLMSDTTWTEVTHD